MNRRYWTLSGAMGVAALLCGPSPALAQVAPPLGVLQQFSVMAEAGVTGSTGTGTVVNGDVGSFPTDSVTNFPPSSVGAGFFVRQIALGDGGLLLQARNDSIAAFLALSTPPQGAGTPIAAQLDTQVLGPGVYDLGAADLANNGTLTLNDATGTGIFVFRTSSTLVANTNSAVIGTANPCNVYWQVGSSATLNGNNFFGNVFANASITIASSNVLTGRAIAGIVAGAVTIAGAGGNTIGGCATAGSAPSGGVPALPYGMEWVLLVILVGTGAYLLNRH